MRQNSPMIPKALSDYMRGLATHDVGLIGSTFADVIRFVKGERTPHYSWS